ncbi:MAG TPA: adenosylcobinamide-phosphate synthase CbiB [Vicinamibacterales bacterium]|jgi:adenosylcobinamide-phosphate synthase|nr:adenosylcobinamide-phosphate synthase CbiB [Vicinamibacterales bacterium]
MANSLIQLLSLLSPNAAVLTVSVVADLAVGDPVYAWHPVRLIGSVLTWMEARLREAGLDGYGGGILLFVGLSTVSLGALAAVLSVANAGSWSLVWLVHAFLLYSLLALGDLLHHVRRIETAVRAGDLPRARHAVSALVGRDTERMDGAACRRAAVESLSENLTDGFASPLFWYVIAGLPGIVLFKVVSTMDSMVGYKTPRHLRFGWCGARLDDAMNYLPARMTWLVVAAIAAVLPAFSGRKAWRVGLRQHGLLLGPNSGWSEAATAGALERQIVGPIWLKGVQVTDLWIGDASDPPLQTAGDVKRAVTLAVLSGLALAAAAAVVILRSHWRGLSSALF